jgi:hypothetical protein
MPALLLMISLLGVATPAQAQRSDECKLCREVQQACLKNHTRDGATLSTTFARSTAEKSRTLAQRFHLVEMASFLGPT